jgi:two-component system nitrogen regulation sensor histidine kinase NtrY
MARVGLLGLPRTTPSGWRARRFGAGATLLVAAFAPVLAIVTALVLARAEDGAIGPEFVRAVLLLDVVYILVLAALIAWTIAQLVAARRARSAGARLHLRLTTLFTIVALAPTVLVAVFATLTVNFGIEAWFSSSVRSVVANALATAEAYEREHRGNIQGDALAMANDLNRAIQQGIDRAAFGDLVRQQGLLRELPEAYVLAGDGDIVARGEFSYLFTLDMPSREQFDAARRGEVVVIEDLEQNEMRALVHLTAALDNYLYVTRRIDGEVLALLDDTRETVALYERLERERANVLFDFALLYVGFALLVILAAILVGLRFAEGLARPIGQLAGAAERVGAGDFDLRVRERRGDDEVAVLSRAFNRMTAQVKAQRDALVAANAETESRRRFIEAVLAGVSAGVIGLDARGRIELANAAAVEMLGLPREGAEGRKLRDAAPPLAPLLDRARRTPDGQAQEQMRLLRGGRERDLLARITPKAEGGAVVTIDELTELVAAQRVAAWGDVARRIAHEIKNPLTPIQLSADRLKRKFRALPEEDRAALDSYADVIARQAGDIRRMVDEFSKFARMPDPETRDEDLRGVVDGAVLLQREARSDVAYRVDAPEGATVARIDRGLMTQALTNLLKNATEAVQARLAERPEPPGEVRLSLRNEGLGVALEVADNGVGLPEADRARLTEPYVTTRTRGTGLGLAIVKKIVEQHGGSLTLTDAQPFAEGAPRGALARIWLPLPGAETQLQRIA